MRKRTLFIGMLLIIAGLALVAVPLTKEWQQANGVAQLEKALAAVQTGETIEKTDDSPSSWTKEQLEAVMELEIPAIDLKQYILDETTDENLALTLTQIKQEQVPGEGNFAVAGHRGYRGDRHFRQLPNVQKGDEIRLHADDGKTYIYVVKSTEIIEPTDVDVLNDGEQPEITLITCTLSGQQRVAVKGDLIDVIEA
ncbi:sortase [Shouchella clausii]|uniref:Sortase n=3 Tax=Shouchella clausii TaxID=79880 RepID=Q5WC12_SHOC1|nr:MULTISPECIES: sortase [Shouchella]MBU3229902.1 sortase [Shouchella clausii]MBU3264014.1 sortase [Shouchella clausii]MBU3506803.1 sortase [Shouchella clausii]MBU3535168.1 sortase [Shouchella clausii]MBX0307853.1 sortase [Shouchella clausii]